MGYEKEINTLSESMAEKIAASGQKTIAVVDFTDLQGNVTELGRFLAEEFSAALVNTGKGFEVIDRVHLKSILKEHKLSPTGFTSFSGLLIFQVLFRRLDLKQRLYQSFPHGELSPIFGRHLVVLLLIVHLIVGFRRLREVDYYRDHPLVLRLMELRKLPDFSTISRSLSKIEYREIEKGRALSRTMVIEGLKRENFPRLTFDFDGSVQSTRGDAEGTAVGFNKKGGVKNGERKTTLWEEGFWDINFTISIDYACLMYFYWGISCHCTQN